MTSTDRPSVILDAGRHDTLAGAPSFTLSNRLFRLAWVLAWLVLARWTPPPFHRWRVLLLNLFGAKVAGNARVYASASIWYPPNLVMGSQATLGPGVICYAMDRIIIGERAVISQRAHLCTGTHLLDDPNFQLVARPIEIGAQAWVAAEAFVGPGVTIGQGAVLGARGVTVKDLEPWTIYAGNPARPIGRRTPFVSRLT
ncbi:acetyltransferase [Devosia geojensis]|uniref:Acetyltransferase n=1 Tax=Devosia geojensis TaxID=443610 RepID=A0A0F5FSD6_9HYPH|nr:acetyltransferase [Devosia geojensis]KKB11062.1 acetyltransferase [Devosia geojensis]